MLEIIIIRVCDCFDYTWFFLPLLLHFFGVPFAEGKCLFDEIMNDLGVYGGGPHRNFRRFFFPTTIFGD
jgi:hypothetical protein